MKKGKVLKNDRVSGSLQVNASRIHLSAFPLAKNTVVRNAIVSIPATKQNLKDCYGCYGYSTNNNKPCCIVGEIQKITYSQGGYSAHPTRTYCRIRSRKDYVKRLEGLLRVSLIEGTKSP
jgi:hypothetical protein